MRSMVGFALDSDGNWKFAPSLNVSAEGIEIPTPKDYTNDLASINKQIEDMNEELSRFNESLSNVCFVIHGDRLTETIGPSMDVWLGENAAYVARNSGTSYTSFQT